MSRVPTVEPGGCRPRILVVSFDGAAAQINDNIDVSLNTNTVCRIVLSSTQSFFPLGKVQRNRPPKNGSRRQLSMGVEPRRERLGYSHNVHSAGYPVVGHRVDESICAIARKRFWMG
jgi:hypothetical protein